MFGFCFDHANLCRHIFQPCFWNQDLSKSSHYQPSPSRSKCASDITLPEGLYKWMLTTVRPTKTLHWINHLTVKISMSTWIVARNIYSPKANNPKMGVWTMILILYIGWFFVIFCCLFSVGPVSNTKQPFIAPRCFCNAALQTPSRISVLRFPSLGIQTVPKTKRSGSRRWRPEARMIAGYTNNTDLSKDCSLRGNSICSYFYGWALVGLLWATLILKGDSTIPYTKNNPASIGTTLRDCHVKLGWWASCLAHAEHLDEYPKLIGYPGMTS